MKKLNLMLLIGLLMLLIGGCTYGSGTSKMSVEVNTLSKMSMSYQMFSGYKATDIKVKEGETLEVSVDIVSEKGKLDLIIEKKNTRDSEESDDSKGKAEKVYEGTDLPTSNFKVTLEEPGEYTVKVTGENHKGSYKVTWVEHQREKHDKEQ